MREHNKRETIKSVSKSMRREAARERLMWSKGTCILSFCRSRCARTGSTRRSANPLENTEGSESQRRQFLGNVATRASGKDPHHYGSQKEGRHKPSPADRPRFWSTPYPAETRLRGVATIIARWQRRRLGVRAQRGSGDYPGRRRSGEACPHGMEHSTAFP